MFASALRKIILSAAILLAGTTAQAGGGSSPDGAWTNEDGEGAVEFYPCGNERCGRIVWLKNPRGDDGMPLHDEQNPNADARKTPICGLEIVRGLQPQRDGSWDNGTIYDPEEGKTYSVAVKVLPGDTLEVTGYLGSKLLGETMLWKRRPANSERCTAP